MGSKLDVGLPACAVFQPVVNRLILRLIALAGASFLMKVACFIFRSLTPPLFAASLRVSRLGFDVPDGASDTSGI
jgi:hypothetical protein